MPATSEYEFGIKRDAVFRTTQWTQVLAAAGEDTPSEAALAELCRCYWYPIYAYVRRRGHSPSDAEDLTQEFFARILERRPFGELSREGGRFRSFLLKALDRMLVDQWRKTIAQKRGAGKVVSLEFMLQDAETRFSREPIETRTPEAIFNQTFALALLERVYAKLESEFAGRENLFAALKPCLLGERANLPYAELAAQLKLTEAAIKTHVHRMRGRFRTLLREAVGELVTNPNDVDAELRDLLRVLAGG